MPVHLAAPDPQSLHPVAGLRIGVAEAGVRKANRKDLTVMLLDEGAAVAGVFTQNRFCAAPVQVCREHLAQNFGIRALVINTGNANAGTGADGLVRARSTCIALARHLEIAPEQVLPFSTGVIMEPLPTDRIEAALPAALADAAEANWARAAEGIMTTDTVPKAFSRQVQVGGATVTITGISKGAGMIRPNMATMLGFLATDACIAPELLAPLARRLADGSFNRVTIDGDTSTNDACVLVATGAAGNAPIDGEQHPSFAAFYAALEQVFVELAHAIIRDGEGATKFVAVEVAGGSDEAECVQVAYTVAESPLVKTALFASDPNWGRILAAIGRAGLADLDVSRISVTINGVLIAENGGRSPHYTEQQGIEAMAPEEITIAIALGRGAAQATVWTTDLSHDYVTINAEYRT